MLTKEERLKLTPQEDYDYIKANLAVTREDLLKAGIAKEDIDDRIDILTEMVRMDYLPNEKKSLLKEISPSKKNEELMMA